MSFQVRPTFTALRVNPQFGATTLQSKIMNPNPDKMYAQMYDQGIKFLDEKSPELAIQSLEGVNKQQYATTSDKISALANAKGVARSQYIRKLKDDHQATNQAFLAREAFQEAQNANPSDLQIKVNMANLMVETNRFDKAAEGYDAVQAQIAALQSPAISTNEVIQNIDVAILMAQLGRHDDSDQQLEAINPSAKTQGKEAKEIQTIQEVIQHNRTVLEERAKINGRPEELRYLYK